MKYLYYIVLIVIGSSLLVGYRMYARQHVSPDVALLINGQPVTVAEFDQLKAARPSYLGDNEFLASLITRKLLIQEAKKQGIDQQEDFRWSIQNFYEQSLIKRLMDAQFVSQKVEITQEELERYRWMLTRQVHLSRFAYPDLAQAGQASGGQVEEVHMPFRELSSAMRERIFTLKEGGMTGPLKMDTGYHVYRLDTVEALSDSGHQFSEDEIRDLLIEQRQQSMVIDWLAGLRDRADIKDLRGQ